MDQLKKDLRVTIMMSEHELAAIDKWSHANKIKSRGEAIRQLIDSAIKVVPVARMVRNYVAHTGPDSENTIAVLWELVHAFSTLKDHSEDGFAEKGNEYTNIFKFEGGDSEAIADVLDFVISGRPETPLTPRESFIIDRIGEGHDDEAIGEIMGISDRVARTYIGMLLDKTGTRNRDELVDAAIEADREGERMALGPKRAINLDD